MQLVLTDVALDDLWRLELKKLHGWECVIENTAGAHPLVEAKLPSTTLYVCMLFCATAQPQSATETAVANDNIDTIRWPGQRISVYA